MMALRYYQSNEGQYFTAQVDSFICKAYSTCTCVCGRIRRTRRAAHAQMYAMLPSSERARSNKQYSILTDVRNIKTGAVHASFSAVHTHTLW